MREMPISGWAVIGALVGAGVGVVVGLLVAQFLIGQGILADEAVGWGRFVLALIGAAVVGLLGVGMGDWATRRF